MINIYETNLRNDIFSEPLVSLIKVYT